MLKYVSVRFINPNGSLSSSTYIYRTNLNMVKGAKYDITADNSYKYDNPVLVVDIVRVDEMSCGLEAKLDERATRKITHAELLGVKVEEEKVEHDIKGVWFNKDKRTTVVKWQDGTITKVVCSENDIFNPECGLAMCYMKRWSFNNRGKFNDVFKKWITKEDNVEVKK